ncbi:sensor histidine kinase [Frankia sp. AgB1.9]|uniref:sensor histidine kinase n=1 Tax=unclassified Frankia TaxID=2632575 RepID=UPI0019348417|nr:MULTISPECIES: histidine kinase [unclassified Frankia]MBL7489848.1 sensor histidine kinase [Frankia sp. AgW1.1]MBL7552692.1 sensor histidine kinase [Frankia sp. AgB1.9]MBL7623857.1 two-component sensor histidine kinase [Frankia sp. AgB1.8]
MSVISPARVRAIRARTGQALPWAAWRARRRAALRDLVQSFDGDPSRNYARALALLAPVAVLALGLPSAVRDSLRLGHPLTLTVSLTVALAATLLFRRRYPFTTFTVVSVIAFSQWLLDVRLMADIALLVALYTVAACGSVWAIIAAGAVMEIGVGLAVDRWAAVGIWITVFVLLSGMVVAAGVLGIFARTRTAYLSQLRQRAERLERERDQQAELATARERGRIAREMHDIVAHHLTVIVALSEGAAVAVGGSPEAARDAMSTVSATGREALADTRRLLGVLRGYTPDPAEAAESPGLPAGEQLAPQPGLASLDPLLDQVRAAGLAVTLTVRGDGRTLPGGLQLAVYRLIQESLTNTLKHAGPGSAARVTLDYLPDRVTLAVVDDGAEDRRSDDPAPSDPTPPDQGPPEQGHGVTGMRERVSAWGGELTCGPLRPRGWRVTACLPRPPVTGLLAETVLPGAA